MGAERLIPLLLVVLATACRTGTQTSATTEPAGASARAVVEWVNDGDTLTLTNGAKVRLVQIDAPELGTDCYGRAALDALVTLAPKGTPVRLVRDAALDDRDRYGRLLRYVFIRGENVNVALVREGAASPYFFRNGRGRYAAQLLDAVDAARKAHRGYWGTCPDARLNTGLGSITGGR
ncbi:MAG TPA: thermonuclease family protein [Gaiella sp.]|nr:thermonuclease family protein [Gaiella sp.]